MYAMLAENKFKKKSDYTEVEKEALQYYSDFNMCSKFKWTIHQLLYETPQEYYDHFSMIMNSISAHQEAEEIRRKHRADRKQGKYGR